MEPRPREPRAPAEGRRTLGVAAPWQPAEDEIDEQVRADLDALDLPTVGRDGPRWFAVTAGEARRALRALRRAPAAALRPARGRDAAGDWPMAHSLLSVPLNLGLLDPLDVVRAAEAAFRAGRVPLASAEGFIRQVLGWREYIWHLYWRFGTATGRRNACGAPAAARLVAGAGRRRGDGPLPATRAGGRARPRVDPPHPAAHGAGQPRRCSAATSPRGSSDWFHRGFVDGYEWVMPPNVIGMSQHADGGLLATKPYTSGGAYINRMSDHCGDCAFDPRKRLGRRRLPVHRGLLGVDAPPPRAAGRQPPHGARRREHGPAGRPGRRAGAGVRPRAVLTSSPLRGARYSERVSRAHVLDLVGTLARLGLAAVWLVSGTLKAIDLDQTVVAVRAYDVLPRAAVDVVAAVLPLLEIALGLLLLVGIGTRLVAVASAVLLLVFIAGVTQAWARGLSIDCGCFGGGGAVAPGADGVRARDAARRRVPRVGRVAGRAAPDACCAEPARLAGERV